MSNPTKTNDPSQTQPSSSPQIDQFESLKKSTAIALIILCPSIALLPPRKLDLYTFTLGSMFTVSANHLTYTYTGRSIFQRLSSTSKPAERAPHERYREVQRQLREQGIMGSEKEGKRVWEKVWMGQETEDWRERRVEEEKQAFENGEGYGSLIARHFRDVFWSRKESGARQENESGGVDRNER